MLVDKVKTTSAVEVMDGIAASQDVVTEGMPSEKTVLEFVEDEF